MTLVDDSASFHRGFILERDHRGGQKGRKYILSSAFCPCGDWEQAEAYPKVAVPSSCLAVRTSAWVLQPAGALVALAFFQETPAVCVSL